LDGSASSLLSVSELAKHYLAYAQGAPAEMVAADTILGAEAAGFYDRYSFERRGGRDGG
jgi:hypothetical protein